MIRVLLLALLSLPAWGGQSLVLTPGNTGSFTVPSSAPWTSISDLRITARLHGVSGCPSLSGIFSLGLLILRCGSSADTINFQDGDASRGAVLDISGRTDFFLRAQRNAASGDISVEVWDADGTDYASHTSSGAALNSLNLAGSRTIGGTSTTMDVAWVRISATLVPIANTPPASGTGDLADWEFEGVLTDSGPSSMTITFGGASYSSTPTYPPIPVVTTSGAPAWSSAEIARAGGTVTLDGTGSYSLVDSPTLTYFWTQTAGPSTAAFSSRTTSTTAVSGLTAGQYTFLLRVTDAEGTSATATLIVGAVATDSNSVVVQSDPEVDFVFGPLIRSGASPWPYSDRMHAALVEHFGSTLPADEWNTALSGTISVTNGSPTITGSGTSFLTDFGNGSACTANAVIVVWYDLGGGATGRRRYNVSSCASNTSMTLTANYDGATDSGLSYAKWTTEGLWIGGSGNVNYYDNVLAYYSLYYRTGITAYLTYARTLADRWWTMPSYIDEGRGCYTGQYCLQPRVRALSGLIWRAHEGRSDMWPGLRTLTDLIAPGQASSTATLVDPREDAYELIHTTLMARLDPDADKRAEYQSAVLFALNNRWTPQRDPAGNWLAWSYGYEGTATEPDHTVTFTNGSTTATKNGGAGYWAADTSGLWIMAAGDSVAYYTQAGSNSTTLTLDRPYEGTTGDKGYQMNVFVGYGTQPFIMGIVASAFSYIYKLTGNTDARDYVTGLSEWERTIGTRTATKGLYYGRVYPPCEPTPDTAPNCTYGSSSNPSVIAGERYLNAEVFNTFSQAYLINSSSTTSTHGDYLFGAALGADGGPSTDSYWANELDETIAAEKHKNLGFFFGFGFAATWPAARLGGVAAADLRTYSFGFTLPAGADRIALEVKRPSGEVVTPSTCTSSPCTFSYDARQGAHLVRHRYETTVGAVRAMSEWQPVQ